MDFFFLVCYEDGIIETNMNEWEFFEGERRHDQTPSGWVIDLRDLKGHPIDPNYSHNDSEIPF